MVRRFTECELDERLFQLRREGCPVALEPKVFDVLAFPDGRAKTNGIAVGQQTANGILGRSGSRTALVSGEFIRKSSTSYSPFS